jgi:ubiquitin-protein ligase
MPCVDPNTGLIINDKLPTTKNWNRNMGIEQILSNLRKEMGNEINRKLKQPPDGSTF